MAHNRKLVLGAVSLVKARVLGDRLAMTQIRDELERVLIEAEWFPAAPFNWVGLVVRYGLKMEEEPHFKPVDKKDGELPLAIEVDTNRILAVQKEPERLRAFFKAVVVRCLLSVARRYKLPAERLALELEALNAA
jgi:hypothetical protein